MQYLFRASSPSSSLSPTIFSLSLLIYLIKSTPLRCSWSYPIICFIPQEEKIKGSFQMTPTANLQFPQPGEFVKEDACSSPIRLPQKPFLLEISNVLAKLKMRTFYLSFSSEQDRGSFTCALEQLIMQLKRDGVRLCGHRRSFRARILPRNGGGREG